MRRAREDASSGRARRSAGAPRRRGARRGAARQRHRVHRSGLREPLSLPPDDRQRGRYAGRSDREHRHRRPFDAAQCGQEFPRRDRRLRSGGLRRDSGRDARRGQYFGRNASASFGQGLHPYGGVRQHDRHLHACAGGPARETVPRFRSGAVAPLRRESPSDGQVLPLGREGSLLAGPCPATQRQGAVVQ